jgi:ArsR family transcriptional regulator
MNIGVVKKILHIEIFKALSDESRLRMLNLLMQKELCVCEIEAILDMSQSNVSRHLNKLKNAAVVISKKESQWTYYKINSSFIEQNVFLYEHLKNKFSVNNELLEDIDKLKNLKEQTVMCAERRKYKS